MNIQQLKPSKIDVTTLAQKHWHDHPSMQDKLIKAISHLRSPQSKRSYVLDSTGLIVSQRDIK